MKTKEENDQRIEKAIENYSIRPKVSKNLYFNNYICNVIQVEKDFNRVIRDTEALISKKNTILDKVFYKIMYLYINGFRLIKFNYLKLMDSMSNNS